MLVTLCLISNDRISSKQGQLFGSFDECLQYFNGITEIFKNMTTDKKTQTACAKQVQIGINKFPNSLKNHRIWLDFNLMYCFCLIAKKNVQKIIQVVSKLDANLLGQNLDLKARFIDVEIVCYEAMNKDTNGHKQ